MSKPENLPGWLPIFLDRARPGVCAIKKRTAEGAKAFKLDQGITEGMLIQHFNGGSKVGPYIMLPGESTTRLLVIDLDNHGGQHTDAYMDALAERVHKGLPAYCRPATFVSSGGKGRHVVCYWVRPQDAYSVRQIAKATLSGLGVEEKAGVAEIFPKQDRVEVGAFGNPVFLPLQMKTFAPWLPSDDVPTSEHPTPPASHPPGSATRQDILLALDALKTIPADEYEIWLRMGMALHQATNGSLEGMNGWVAWSRTSANFGQCEEKWASFKSGPTTLGTLFHEAQKYGWNRRQAEIRIVGQQLETLKAGLGKQVGGDLIPDPGAHPQPLTLSGMLDDLEPPFFLVEGCLQRRYVVGVIGHPGGGKTVIWLDIALRLCLGMEVLGRRTDRQRVAYLASENPEEVKLRIKLWCIQNHVPPKQLDGWFALLPGSYDLADPRAIKALVSQLNPTSKVPLGLLVVDTFSANYFGESENDATEVSKWFNTVRAGLVDVLGCAVVVLGHPVKDASNEEAITVWRGSGAIQGTLDATFGVTMRRDSGIVTMTAGKRRGPLVEDMHWHIKTSEVGNLLDNFGNPVVSVIAEAASRGVVDGYDMDQCAICYGIEQGWTRNHIYSSMGRSSRWLDARIEEMKKNPRKLGENKGRLYCTALGKEHALEAEKYLPMLYPRRGEVE